MSDPYSGLPKNAYWRTGVTEASPFDLHGIYKKKWPIEPLWKIGTAGSCFAQHISRQLKRKGLNVLDVEPPPPGLPKQDWTKFGYDMYSARYGNVYTVHQLLQIVQEISTGVDRHLVTWKKGDRFFDAMRPSVEPEGFDSWQELVINRRFHLRKVKEMLSEADLFIFTLGLTETWQHKESGKVYPTAPGTICGSFDPDVFTFKNFNFGEVVDAFNAFQEEIKKLRPSKDLPRILLTVSPVPLTATASGMHVLSATSYSKSVLRAVAGYLAESNDHIDYFPSYEIITNQAARAMFYEPNLRSIRSEGVNSVMRAFFAEHDFDSHSNNQPTMDASIASIYQSNKQETVQCDEELLEAFNAKA